MIKNALKNIKPNPSVDGTISMINFQTPTETISLLLFAASSPIESLRTCARPFRGHTSRVNSVNHRFTRYLWCYIPKRPTLRCFLCVPRSQWSLVDTPWYQWGDQKLLISLRFSSLQVKNSRCIYLSPSDTVGLDATLPFRNRRIPTQCSPCACCSHI